MEMSWQPYKGSGSDANEIRIVYVIGEKLVANSTEHAT